ncbi:unnamed protein product [Calypogeia fissa]
METSDINALQIFYEESCERHGVSPQQAIKAAFVELMQKACGSSRSNRDPLVLNLVLDHLTQADLLPIVDSFRVSKSNVVDILDVHLNNTVSGALGLLVVQLLRAAGSKVRTVDLRDISFGREALRDLFQGGLSCQILDLSFARVRKLDMIGEFSLLHTLNLDYSSPVNNLPDGCFQGMPKLARLSMCGTGVANLWTTCAALSRLPNLIELRFQKCVCCLGTGQCATSAANEVMGPWFRENLGFTGRTPMLDWGPLNGDDYDSPDTLQSRLSQTEEEESDDLFSDEDLGINHSRADTSSGESSAESEMDFHGEVNQVQSMDFRLDDDIDYHGDVEADREAALTLAVLEASDSSAPSGVAIPATTVVDKHISDDIFLPEQEGRLPSEDEVPDVNGISGLQSSDPGLQPLDELGGADQELQDFLGTSNVSISDATTSPLSEGSFRHSHRLRPEGASGTERGESSEDEGREQYSFVMPNTAISSRLTGSRHAAPICSQRYYREFMVTTLSGLKVLDNMLITESEKDRAGRDYVEHFELLANNRSNENVIKVLRRREIGGWGLTAHTSDNRSLGMVVNETSKAGLNRSLCAAKMASCVWPTTNTICRLKNSNLDMSRKCKPRQFEYHPTESSYMVFGTLSGEVVVVNHESNKVVGCVQSIGAPHSILGLCWLNKDPHKLIAGSDNGSLQLYDVNHMRATMVTSGHSGARPDSGNLSDWGSPARSGSRTSRSPAIYTYDDFEQLTSVHINSTDDYFLASGYSKHVGMYDLRTGKRLEVFTDLHEEHINVVKFAHHSPFLFATSSFDKEIKMWDIRIKAGKPLYTTQSNRGNVMVCFSQDDHYLLSSAVDNEVRQHLAVDGRLHMKFDIPALGSHQNYTRSYYMNGRDYIITGSCEENVVRICCAQTGRHLRDLSLEGRGFKKTLYVQSLRGDPFRDFHFSVLVAYNSPHSRSEIVKVNMLVSDTQQTVYEAQSEFLAPTRMGG